jgi:hypothetical protein
VTGLKKGLGELGYSPQTAQILEMKVARPDESAAKVASARDLREFR